MICVDVKVGFGYFIIVFKMKYYMGRKKFLLCEYVLNFILRIMMGYLKLILMFVYVIVL